MNGNESTTAFYAVADANHFLGLVGLLNSLRLAGHDEPLYVADCGLSPDQRRRLDPHVELVVPPVDEPPNLLKTVAPLAHPADVMVLVDADMIVTRPLDELIERARSGKIVAFVDRVSHRFDARWPELLGLGPLRRQPYVNSGLLALDRERGTPVLERVRGGCRLVDPRFAYGAGGRPDYPFIFLDQDVVNAVLASLPAAEVALLEHELAPFPPFPGLALRKGSALGCAYADGREPFLLHHVLAKPWLTPTRSNLYSRLLGRLLAGPDVALALPDAEIPLRLRSGALAWLEKRRCDALAVVSSQRGRLGVRAAFRRRNGESTPAEWTATAPGGAAYAPPWPVDHGE